jgi:hypothetical protein
LYYTVTVKERLQIGWRRGVAIVGILGTLACVVLFILHPSWPTPDRLLLVLTFLFMIFNQALRMLRRLLPYVIVLLVYELFRSLIPHINGHVHYALMPMFDQKMFGGQLPTSILQSWWWHGRLNWYDFMFYQVYMLYFTLPTLLVLLVWKLRPDHYWRVVNTFLGVAFAAFITYALYPAAPPWIASNANLIPHIERTSSLAYQAMNIQNTPSAYNVIPPNLVAAVPSLHAIWATLFAIFVWRLFGKRWGLLASLYPILTYVGTVYMGEHYAFDEILGIVYAAVAYATVYSFSFAQKPWPRPSVIMQTLRGNWQKPEPLADEEADQAV